jgi:hypothetical protein
MDLGTMLRRVKGKHYRSKKEFKDDLDLVWQNCFTYNHAEVSMSYDVKILSHVLRPPCPDLRIIPYERRPTD